MIIGWIGFFLFLGGICVSLVGASMYCSGSNGSYTYSNGPVRKAFSSKSYTKYLSGDEQHEYKEQGQGCFVLGLICIFIGLCMTSVDK
jgi:hypothetical protein